jgi:hypothetical protein
MRQRIEQAQPIVSIDDPDCMALHGQGETGEQQGQHDIHVQPEENARRVEQARNRRIGLAFVSQRPFLPRLVILCVVVQAQQDLMRKHLALAGEQWDKDQDAKVAASLSNGKVWPREVRSLIAAAQSLENDLLAHLSQLLAHCREWLAMPRSGLINANTTLAFRLISIAGGACYDLLARPHSGYPWKCWALAAGALGDSLATGL